MIALKRLQIETTRLEIRPLKVSDFKQWQTTYLHLKLKKQSLWDLLPKTKKQLSFAKFKSLLKSQAQARKLDQAYELGLFLKTGEYIGFVLYSDIIRSIQQTTSIGYRLFNPYWGKAYAREALDAFITFGFEELRFHRIEALIEPKNKRSIRVIQKVGFRREGTSFKRIYRADAWQNAHIFAITSEKRECYVHLDVSEDY